MITEDQIKARLHEARAEQRSHGHDWDIADVVPVITGLLGEAWREGRGDDGGVNPYEVSVVLGRWLVE